MANKIPETQSRNDMMVVKANKLIQQTRYSLSLTEQKILLRIISMIDPNEKATHPHLKFDLYEFTKLCGNEVGNGNNYSRVVDYLTNLRSQTFSIFDAENNKETVLGWINDAELNYGTSVVDVEVNSKIMPYLTNLKSLYTTYNINYVLTMKSTYSIRFYEFFKSWDNGDNGGMETFYDIFLPVDDTIDRNHIGWRYKDFDIQQLKEMLSPTDEQIRLREERKATRDVKQKKSGVSHREEKPLTERYKNFADFRRFVLDKAFAEINECTDLDAEWVGLSRRGNKRIDSIRVFLRYKTADQIRELRKNFPDTTVQVIPPRHIARPKKTEAEGQLSFSKMMMFINPINYREVANPEDFVFHLKELGGCNVLQEELTAEQMQALNSILTILVRLSTSSRNHAVMVEGANKAVIDQLNQIFENYGNLSDWMRGMAIKYEKMLRDDAHHSIRYFEKCVENDLVLPQPVIQLSRADKGGNGGEAAKNQWAANLDALFDDND